MRVPRRIPLLLAALAVLLASVGAHAQGSPDASPPSSTRSPARAQMLSVAHTAAAATGGMLLLRGGTESDLLALPGFALLSYGVLAAPSAGSLYAGDRGRTGVGVAVRAAGGALIVASAWRHLLSGGIDLHSPDREPPGWDALNVTGAALVAGGTVYSIATAPASAREFNRRSPATPSASVVLAHQGRGAAGLDVRF